jgi:hypothetical protein
MHGMRTARLAAAAFAVALTAACSHLRWSGGPASDARPPKDGVALSTGPARARLVVAVPETPTERLHAAEFYSDLGPDKVDVSGYPAQQRYNYSIYAAACSRCHTLARSVNAPIVGRGWWEFYMAGMRLRSRWRGRPFSSDEIKAILDFLEYDGRTRKVDRAREFELATDELKKRFDQEIERRVGEMQKANRRPMVAPSPR